MKKTHLLSLLAALPLAVGVTSCSSDDDFDDLETIAVSQAQFQYDSEGVWTLNDQPGYLNINDYEFSHIIDENKIIYGFTPSKVTDTSKHSPLYTFPYASASGGGVSGPGSQYLVGYWAEYLEDKDGDGQVQFQDRICRIYAEDGDRFQPQSVMVCNTTYVMYAALDGTDFTAAFGPGDYLNLIAHGVHLDGTEAQTTFTLINIESDSVKDGILTSWMEFDLTSLGTCTGIYFTMDCSDNFKSAWGMDIPAYFCLDRLVVKD